MILKSKTYVISKEQFKKAFGITSDKFYVSNLSPSDDVTIEVYEDTKNVKDNEVL